jgi:hypothetical protein
MLGVPTSDVVALFKGEVSPDAQQLALMESHIGIPAVELLEPFIDDGARQLLSPVWKDDILAIAAHFGEDELSAREDLRAEYALAARATGNKAGRMRAAVNRLLGRQGR